MDKVSPWQWAETVCELCGHQQIEQFTTMYAGSRAVRTDRQAICGDKKCPTNAARKYDD